MIDYAALEWALYHSIIVLVSGCALGGTLYLLAKGALDAMDVQI